jgi:catechol 2,3-dioxygenase-like lactoylglutathione lyase family enzyme
MPAFLEHANVTVSNPDTTAAWMSDLFGWQVRWSGAGMETGRTVHVGTDSQYLALFSYDDTKPTQEDNYRHAGGLNHIAVVVDDIADMRKRVEAKGFKAGEHHDYEPGQRFYFHDDDGIEYEVVQYD